MGKIHLVGVEVSLLFEGIALSEEVFLHVGVARGSDQILEGALVHIRVVVLCVLPEED